MTRRFNVLLALVLGVAFGVWTERATYAEQPAPKPVVRIVQVEQPDTEPAEPAEPARTVQLPACYEDERVWGVGDFMGRERGWERYVCRHVDWIYDLEGGE